MKMKNNTGHFYYSELQKQRVTEMNAIAKMTTFNNYALIDGKIVLYTEWQDDNVGSNFPDAVYLGFGEYHHNEIVSKGENIFPPLDTLPQMMMYAQEKMEWPDVI